MSKVKKIELSFVCDEDWNKMPTVDAGRHCSSCSKTVVNFSNLSDEQVIAFYSKKGNAKECGNFRIGQLEYINQTLARPVKKQKFSFFKPFLASVLLSSAACSDTTKKVTPTHQEESNKEPEEDLVLGKVCTEPIEDSLAENKPFQPRKITYVKRLNTKSDTLKTQNLPEHEVIESYPEIEMYQMAGVPMITYNEVHKKGEIEVTPVEDKKTFFQRLFKRKDN